jgi:cell division protein FtsI/penicillin-binding protein 2
VARRGVIWACLFWLLSLWPLKADSLTAELEKLNRLYGEFGFVVTNPKTGLLLYLYNEDLIFKRSLCPGSLLKPFALLALARSTPIEPEKRIVCKGDGHEISCWDHAGHGSINLPEALAYSCNYYFYYLLKDSLLKEDYAATLKEFGLPPFTALGELAKNDFYKAAIGLNSNYTVTPVEMICAYNALFNGGVLRNGSGEKTGQIYIPEQVSDILIQGLRECALFGTGKKIWAGLGNMDLIIKTGTGASLVNGREVWYKRARWVLLLSPGVDPTFSMLVVMEKKEAESIQELTIALLRLLKTR